MAETEHVPEQHYQGVGGFLKSVRDELRRVTWPNRQQVAVLTGVVIVFVLVMGAFLGGLDFIAQRIVQFLLGL